MQLNERITQARKQAGLTQEQLGEALGVSRQAVSKWESGQANPDVTYIAKMCALFQVSSDWFLFGKEPGGEDRPRCGECCAVIPAGAEYCPQCGVRLDGKGGFCLYLLNHDDFSWGLAQAIELLFQQPWAKPAFLWEGGEISAQTALTFMGSAPMVLCRGLTEAQAEKAVDLFGDYWRLLRVYRDEDMVESENGTLKPSDDRKGYSVPEPEREPLSGGAIFGLVVLGVIVGVLILSLF